MAKVILDSDLLSELLKGVNLVVARRSNAYRSDERVFTFASLTTLKILSGFEHLRSTGRIKRAEALFDRSKEIVLQRKTTDFRRSSLEAHFVPVNLMGLWIPPRQLVRYFGVMAQPAVTPLILTLLGGQAMSSISKTGEMIKCFKPNVEADPVQVRALDDGGMPWWDVESVFALN